MPSWGQGCPLRSLTGRWVDHAATSGARRCRDLATRRPDGFLALRKGNGLVSEVFKKDDVHSLCGNIGIGHCRYPTAGCSSSAEAQPFYTNTPCGLCLGHNGSLTNTSKIYEGT